MAWNDHLDPTSPAYRIASDAGPRIRVLAGPGTGKSFAIKRRITRLLEEGTDPTRVLAVTFTRMSAADLLRDIRSLEAPGAQQVLARTLHAECFRILGKNAVLQITGRTPRALSPFEIEPLLADLRLASPGSDKRALRRLIRDYESAWARLQHEQPGAPRDVAAQVFEAALLAWMRFHRAILIGELVPLAYQYLRDNPAAPERAMYDHLLVDEYQDLNRAEQEVATLLAAPSSLIVVGDDDQSIYTFKNAHRTGIIEFPASHPGTHDHTMAECQRCPGLVVSLANSLISRNQLRSAPPRSLQPLPANGRGVVEVLQFDAHAAEIEHLATRVQRFVAEDRVPPGQIIVLCQARRYVRDLYDRLRGAGVPIEFCYQEGQLDDEHATERMAMLALAGSNADRVCLRYLVGLGSTDWRASQWEKVRDLCNAENLSPWEVLEAMADRIRAKAGCTHLVTAFVAIRNELQRLTALRGQDLVNAWLPDAEACAELREIANRFVATSPECDAGALADAIRDEVEEPEIPDSVQHVRIMSLHKSKGLSANVVIISGCVEGLIPRTPDTDDSEDQQRDAIEESRRVFFVGLTRVKAAPAEGRPGHLILSSSLQVPKAIALQSGVAGRRGWRTVTTIASRFLRELGHDCPASINP